MGRGVVAVFTAALLAVCATAAADVLFPKALHIVRRIDDPITKKTTTADEYCAGNRIVTIAGPKVAIADYEKQQLTEIDHRAMTYSVTPFAEIASARPEPKRAAQWKATPRGAKASAGGKSLDAVEYRDDAGGRVMEVGIDREVALSRAAVEALIGAAYPHARNDEHDALLRASDSAGEPNAKRPAGGTATYGLPAEQSVTYEAEGETLVFRNAVLRVGDELPPAELMIIPPGARRVESRWTRATRELRELDVRTQR